MSMDRVGSSGSGRVHQFGQSFLPMMIRVYLDLVQMYLHIPLVTVAATPRMM